MDKRRAKSASQSFERRDVSRHMWKALVRLSERVQSSTWSKVEARDILALAFDGPYHAAPRFVQTELRILTEMEHIRRTLSGEWGAFTSMSDDESAAGQFKKRQFWRSRFYEEWTKLCKIRLGQEFGNCPNDSCTGSPPEAFGGGFEKVIPELLPEYDTDTDPPPRI